MFLLLCKFNISQAFCNHKIPHTNCCPSILVGHKEQSTMFISMQAHITPKQQTKHPPFFNIHEHWNLHT